MTRFQGKLPFGRRRCNHRGRRGKDWGRSKEDHKCAAVHGSYWKSLDGIEQRHREELTHINCGKTSMQTGSRSRKGEANKSCGRRFIHSIIPKDFFFFISNEDKCLSASCAEQVNHHGRDMLCDGQQRLNCARYLPRLSDCGALVGVLLVFILFKAPLTISETRNKPNGVKHLWQDDVILP